MAKRLDKYDTGEPYIYQWSDHERYVVRMTANGHNISRYFGFKACGGKEKAMKLAKECRDELLQDIADGVFQRRLVKGEPNLKWESLGKRSKRKPKVVSQFLLWAGRNLNGEKVD